MAKKHPFALALMPLCLALLAVGIAQTVFAVRTLDRLNYAVRYQRTSGYRNSTITNPPVYGIDWAPRGIRKSIIESQIGCGALAIAMAIVVGFWAANERDSNARGGRMVQNLVSFFVSGATSATIVLFAFSFAYTYLNYDLPFQFPPANANTSINDPFDRSNAQDGPWDDQQRLPWETWTCRFSNFFSDTWWSTTCDMTRTGRWLMLPVAMLMIVVTVISYLQIAVALRRIQSKPVQQETKEASRV